MDSAWAGLCDDRSVIADDLPATRQELEGNHVAGIREGDLRPAAQVRHRENEIAAVSDEADVLELAGSAIRERACRRSRSDNRRGPRREIDGAQCPASGERLNGRDLAA